MNSPITGKALYTVHMPPRLKLKSRWATENNIRRSRDTGSGQDACLARSTNVPANSACAIALRWRSSPARNSQSTDGRTRPGRPPGVVPSIPNRLNHLKSPEASLGRTLRVKINSLGKSCLSLVPRPMAAARLALHIGSPGSPAITQELPGTRGGR